MRTQHEPERLRRSWEQLLKDIVEHKKDPEYMKALELFQRAGIDTTEKCRVCGKHIEWNSVSITISYKDVHDTLHDHCYLELLKRVP